MPIAPWMTRMTYLDEPDFWRRSTEGSTPPDEVRTGWRPWPQRFIVSRHMLMYDAVELRPLTITGIVKGLATNLVTINYWRILRVLRRVGFLTTIPGMELSLRDWRWAFWRTYG